MILIHEAKMLHTLHQSLSKSIPEAIKVYGSIFHINRGNPFNLEVLVDSWPDYQTVITRPQKQEMMDDKDCYTNTYQIFSKDLQKLPEILGSESVINWRQSLTIQGVQKGFNEKIRDIAASKSVYVDDVKILQYITDDDVKSNTSNTNKLTRSHEATTSETVKFRRASNNFKLCLLDVSHAELVNNTWKYGQNDRSLRFLRRCLQNFPGYCMMDPQRIPISWVIMEHTSELRAGYTLPEYRNRGFGKQVISAFIQYLQKNDMPFYFQVEEMNVNSHKLLKSCGLHVAKCGWHVWKCSPAKIL
ncbi:glycine N-acyltransferase-like protein 2 [Notamacropus eugenii]|uniref:glycine N-acyltransferase-like protein 2 n=1 Tax=Notamacropus eugenii TaxID=9315 RepID=UPI003B6833CA